MASGNSNVSLPLSRAERLRQYHRRFPGPGRRLNVRLTDKRINGLVKRGYLGPNELDNERAISQALRLFLWDALIGDRRQTATKAVKRLGDRKSPRSGKSTSISRGATTT
jgi:hypothetical protein